MKKLFQNRLYPIPEFSGAFYTESLANLFIHQWQRSPGSSFINYTYEKDLHPEKTSLGLSKHLKKANFQQ